MLRNIRAAAALLLAASLFFSSNAAVAGVLQCAPYARQISGIALYGNASTWWDQAEGRYGRGHQPKVGAVLAFTSTPSMRAGHVAMVSKVVNSREVLLTHANWSAPGMVEHDVRAVDVSPDNDWTDVRVWYAPLGDVGKRSNHAFGFIYPDAAGSAPADTLPAGTQIAMASMDAGIAVR